MATTTTTVGSGQERPTVKRERVFYLGATLLLVVLVFLGFRLFYIHGQAYPGRPLTPLIRTQIIVVMTLWMLLLTIQSLLIVSRKHKWHRMQGRVGAVLAVVVLITAWRVAVSAARVNPPALKLWGMDPVHFLIVPLSAIVVYTAFVAIGIWQRNKPSIHRPMMFLATLTVVTAAIDRIGPLNDLFHNTIFGATWGPYFPPLVLALALLAVKYGLTRSFDRWFAIGTLIIGIVGIVVMHWGPTPHWESMANLLIR